MLYNADIHKYYIDRQHRTIRRLMLFVLFVIGCSIGTIFLLLSEVRSLKAEVKFYRGVLK